MGYSFAIPSAIVKKVVVDLKEYGVVQRALLGVSYREIDEEFVEAFGEEYGIRETGGVYVADVSEYGAAKAAGIRKGDVITAIDGIRLGNNTNLAEIMSRYRPNDKVTISVKRDGKTKQFEVVLRNKAGKAELLSRDYVDVAESLGGRFAEINDRTRREPEDRERHTGDGGASGRCAGQGSGEGGIRDNPYQRPPHPFGGRP